MPVDPSLVFEKGHTIEMEGRVASCTVCEQSWGDCNRFDVRNLMMAMKCPGSPTKARACRHRPNTICHKAACFDGCVLDRE